MNTHELQALDRSLARNGFERCETIGHGVDSTVFRCHQVRNGQDHALKWWSADFRNPARGMELTSYLCDLKRRVRDRVPPNCVSIRAVAPKRRYVIMSLMKANVAVHQGGSAMDPDRAIVLLRQSLECLNRLHGRRTIHAALKPANVFVGRKDQFLLSDSRFIPVNTNGLVEDIDCLSLKEPSRAGAAGNTLASVTDALHAKYMAPESINPEFGPRGVWLDQFMLGFLVFELLVGPERFESLFPGVGSEAMDVELGWLRWHGSRERTPSPYDVLPNLDSGLKNVVHRLTRKEVDKRYSDVRAAIQALLQDSVTTRIMPGLDHDDSDALATNAMPMLEDSAAEDEPEERSGWLRPSEVATSPAFRKGTLQSSTRSGGLVGAVNPFEDLEPERFTREWWDEKLAEPRTVRRLKVAGAVVGLSLLMGLFGSGPEKSRVIFTSTTPGIEVRVNGERVELDRELDYLVGKEIAIEATASQFEPLAGLTERIEASSKPKVLSIELEPRVCQLRVDPGLPGATVTLNGKSYSGDTGEFPLGTRVVIEWSAPGYVSETKTFVIPENATKKLRFSGFARRAKPRPVLVSTSPPGATVRTGPDGKMHGKSGDTFELGVGTHSIRLELDGYEPLDLGPIEIQPGEGTHDLGEFVLKPLFRRGNLEVTTEPAEASVEIVALDESGREIPGMTPGTGGEVTVGSTWRVTASHAGRSQTKQIKVAEGPNRLSFSLSIISRIRNQVGMEFVYVNPPEGDFEFGNRKSQKDEADTPAIANIAKSSHGLLREVSRGPWSPKALVVHQEAVKVPRRPAFQVPPVKVRVSMGIYVGVDEVTVGDWRRVMGERPRFMSPDVPENHPVAGVLRNEAYAFLNKMARIEGLPPGAYRLLTDAEFDYLAKHGEAKPELATLAESNRRNAGPVDRNGADQFGLRELHGNLAEIVEDYFVRGYHEHFRNRTDPVQHRPTDVGIARGCHFGISAAKFASDFRMFVNERSRDFHVGFRVVRNPDLAVASSRENGVSKVTETSDLSGFDSNSDPDILAVKSESGMND
ncbi:SUMF1/EgtB/PvdO family nonheme iron enzyme [bacterium]|nr:SUMF1/EgtB/PvdO family nonheme iron enzyme [bacterium]